MGVWAVSTFRLMFNMSAVAAACFFACIAVYAYAPYRRWFAYTTLTSFGVALLLTVGFLSTSYYYQVVNPKPVFMAQCQMRDTQQTCLSSYRQFYPSRQ